MFSYICPVFPLLFGETFREKDFKSPRGTVYYLFILLFLSNIPLYILQKYLVETHLNFSCFEELESFIRLTLSVEMLQSLHCHGNSLAIQWLGLRAFTAEGPGSIPGWGTKIPQATQCGQKFKKQKKEVYIIWH